MVQQTERALEHLADYIFWVRDTFSESKQHAIKNERIVHENNFNELFYYALFDKIYGPKTVVDLGMEFYEKNEDIFDALNLHNSYVFHDKSNNFYREFKQHPSGIILVNVEASDWNIGIFGDVMMDGNLAKMMDYNRATEGHYQLIFSNNYSEKRGVVVVRSPKFLYEEQLKNEINRLNETGLDSLLKK